MGFFNKTIGKMIKNNLFKKIYVNQQVIILEMFINKPLNLKTYLANFNSMESIIFNDLIVHNKSQHIMHHIEIRGQFIPYEQIHQHIHQLIDKSSNFKIILPNKVGIMPGMHQVIIQSDFPLPIKGVEFRFKFLPISEYLPYNNYMAWKNSQSA